MDKVNVGLVIGIGYIFLGGYYYQGFTSINEQTIAGFSLSAFGFALSDSFVTWSEKYQMNRRINSSLLYIAYFINVLALIIMVVFPFLKLDKFEISYDIVGTTTLFVGFGLSLSSMSIRADRNNKNVSI